MNTSLISLPTRFLLDGVERCGFDKTANLCFVGSTVVSMHYLGDQVSNDYLMGVSGGAFSMFWIPPWSPANCDLLIIGEEPIQKTFTALGYDYRFVRDYNRQQRRSPDFYRETITQTITKGLPVMALGVVGPPEVCVITGYDKGGDILYGWSYFQDSPETYFTSSDWYENIYGLILIGLEEPKPGRVEVLRNSLEWAIELARVPKRDLDISGQDQAGQCYSGLAAFDAMIAGLERDEDFPAGDLETLTSRTYAVSNDGTWLMTDKRRVAGSFLKSMVDESHPSAPHLWKAAEAYAQESATWQKAAELSPWSGAPEAERLLLADPQRRRDIARLVRAARDLEEQAVSHLEAAFKLF